MNLPSISKKLLLVGIFVAAALAAASCQSGEKPRNAAIPGLEGGAQARATVAPRATAQDALGSIYPPSVEPQPLARELCDALHALPAARAAACCGTRSESGLGDQCVRAVSAALRDGAVEIDESSIAACRAAMERALEGCDWVTPSEPLSPPACQRLLRGKLSVGSVCRSSLECAGESHCEGLGPTKTGVCAAPAARGEGCGAHIDVLATYTLERGLERTHPFCAEYCSLATHRCAAPPEIGDSCLSAVNCAPGQTCVAGACSSAAPGRAGDRCGASPCGEGLHCREGICAPLAAAGQACVGDLDCAAGGCGRRGGGEKTCGAQCTPSFEALARRAEGPTLGLPRARP